MKKPKAERGGERGALGVGGIGVRLGNQISPCGLFLLSSIGYMASRAWRFGTTATVGHWVAKGEPLELICMSCRRIVEMPVAAMRRYALASNETQQSFSIRLRCKACGGSGVPNCGARMSYWEGSWKDIYRG